MTENKQLRPFEKLRGGINLSGPFEGNILNNPNSWIFDEKYFKIIADKGFNNIRLPLNFLPHVGEYPEYRLNPAFFEKLDYVVNMALKYNFYIILDCHGSGYTTNPYRYWQFWEQMAEHYKDFPEEVMFELINEPSPPTEDGWLNELQAEAFRRIRKTNPTRGIALACNQWNGTWKILSINWDLFDENCFIDVHNYYTMNFTHQNANWGANADEDRSNKEPFTQDTANEVTRHIELCADYQKKTGRTIWIGECGVYFDGADPVECAKYVEHFTKECARFGISYAWWEFNVGFGLFNHREGDWKHHLTDNMTVKW